MRASRGFTLIELVTAITIGAIVVSFAAMFISTPVQMYATQTQRAALVDSADSLLRLMARDVRRALPNSVRTSSSGSVVALEVLLTVDGVRYRDDDAVAADDLDFSAPDNEFATIGPFSDQLPRTGGTFDSNTHYLSIYNVGIAGANAYELGNVITPANTRITITAEGSGSNRRDRVTLNPSMQFAYGSPARRVYLVSGAVSYLCDTATGTVRRYSGYAISSAQPVTTSSLGSGSLVANRVAACTFNYAAGTAQRAGLVTLDVTVGAAAGERVRLLHQVHVENVP